MRLCNSASSASGTLTLNGRIASLDVDAACAWEGIKREAATAAEAARTLRRSGDGSFADMISLLDEAESRVSTPV
jgi:hypothetical protein